MAVFREIEQLFTPRGLTIPRLECLEPTTKLYEVLAIQPVGDLAASPDFVGHADQTAAREKFGAFLQLAVHHDSDLVLSPEYSLPWDCLDHAIATDSLPSPGKLWILGCESIQPEHLRQIVAKYPSIEWLHEDVPTGTGNFLGVVAYVTKATNAAGDVKDVIVLQFKTKPMGGIEFERDNLLTGEVIYLWHNPTDNIRLATLICADVLQWDAFGTTQCRFDLYPYLIYHPQLNPSPRHAEFLFYRASLFGATVSDRFEVLALNWARGFALPSAGQSSYGGSTYYTKSPRFDLSDERINHNHSLGLYFSYWHDRRTQLCLFNFDEHVFRFRTPRVLQIASGTATSRTGPEMLTLFSWKSAERRWIDAANANDGFADLCASYGHAHCDFFCDPQHSPLARERLIALSSGRLADEASLHDWHNVQNMDSVRAASDERTKRITFTHEQARESQDYRDQLLQRFATLQLSILSQKGNYPESIADLFNDWQLVPPSKPCHFNLKSKSGSSADATAIFLGLVAETLARRSMDELVTAWGLTETRRLVVWYDTPNGIQRLSAKTPTILDSTEPPTVITRGSYPNEP